MCADPPTAAVDFSGRGKRMLSLVPPRPQVETNFATEHRCAFWAKIGGARPSA